MTKIRAWACRASTAAFLLAMFWMNIVDAVEPQAQRVGGSGGRSTGGTYELYGLMGFTEPGTKSSGGEYDFISGQAGLAPSPWSYELGDVNHDGKVDAIDIQLVINAALGLAMPAKTYPDINGDGVVDAVDVQWVINAVLGVG